MDKLWQGFVHRLLAGFGIFVFLAVLFQLFMWFLEHYWLPVLGGWLLVVVGWLLWQRYRYW